MSLHTHIGYVQYTKKKRLNACKALIGVRSHLEVARGTAEDNKKYCTKEPRVEVPFEHGEISIAGKRTDIESFVDSMNDKILSTSEIIQQHPMILAKYPRFVSTVRRVLKEKAYTPEPYVPQPGWQTELVEYLRSAPDNRKIRFYVDPTGKTGKSWFADHYMHSGERPYVVTGGKHSDIQYAYDYQELVIFDWSRCNEELLPFAVIENFKNGYFLNTKYECVPMWFKVPHVIVFSNHPPDRSKLSEDRWDIHNIRNFI